MDLVRSIKDLKWLYIEILNTLSHYYPEDNKYHDTLTGQHPGPKTVEKYPNRDLKRQA